MSGVILEQPKLRRERGYYKEKWLGLSDITHALKYDKAKDSLSLNLAFLGNKREDILIPYYTFVSSTQQPCKLITEDNYLIIEEVSQYSHLLPLLNAIANSKLFCYSTLILNK